jgi:outer membrane murein-binding lipoprotein Lpp
MKGCVFMKKIAVLLMVAALLTGCGKTVPSSEMNSLQTEYDTLQSKYDELEKNIKNINTDNTISNKDTINDNDEIIADTVLGMTAYGRKYISSFISDDVLQIIATAEENPQDEFNQYYNYSGEAIISTCEAFGISAIYVKTVDTANNPIFEICFTADSKSYLIGYDYLDEITEIIE